MDLHRALTKTAAISVRMAGDNSKGLENTAASPMPNQSCSRADRGAAEDGAHIWALKSLMASALNARSEAIARAAEAVPLA